MTTIADQLAINLAAVNGRIAAACARAGRGPEDVTLVAVTKYARPECVRGLVSQGVRELGESRPQQLAERAEWFDASIRWHLIGSLQRNKVRKMLQLRTRGFSEIPGFCPTAVLIHSVDSLRLLSAIDRIAAEEQLQPRVLLEVNIAREEAKHGFAPQELLQSWSDVAAASHVSVAGLMTMAPWDDDPERSRPVFRRLRELRDELQRRSAAIPLPELSMGMSGDYEVAVEEGATLVRIGSRLFEGLAE
jgi:PLP dependent protein